MSLFRKVWRPVSGDTYMWQLGRPQSCVFSLLHFLLFLAVVIAVYHVLRLEMSVFRHASGTTVPMRRTANHCRKGTSLAACWTSMTRPSVSGSPQCTAVCLFVGWLVGCLTSQQQASVSQWRICSDNFACCHTEIEVADQTFYLTQSQYTDTRPTSPRADPITPGRVATGVPILSHWYDSTPKKYWRKRDLNPGPSAHEANALPLGQRGGCALLLTVRVITTTRAIWVFGGLVGLVVSGLEGSRPGIDPCFPSGFFFLPGQVIAVTWNFILQRLPCQVPGVVGSAPELVGLDLTEWYGKFDLQLLSQCGSQYNCLSRSVPETLYNVAGTYNQQHKVGFWSMWVTCRSVKSLEFLCPAGWLSGHFEWHKLCLALCANFSTRCFFSILAILLGTSDLYHFMPLSVALVLAEG